MSRFQIGIVFALLVVLAVVGLVFRLTTSDAEVEKISGVNALTEDEIDRIVIRDLAAPQDGQQTAGEVTLWKVEGGWLAGPEGHRYRTYNTKMQEILEASGNIHSAELVARNPVNHEGMGVSAEHAKVVEFWNGQDLIERFLVGDKAFIELGGRTPVTPWTRANQSCFVRLDGKDEVYSVYCSRPDVFDAISQQWATPIIARIPSHEVESIHFTYRDEEFDLKPFGSVWVVEDELTQEQANERQVRDVLRQIQPVAASDFPSREEVEGLDFDAPDVNIIFTALPEATVESFTLRLIKRGDEGEHYVNVAGEPYVYVFGSLESGQLLKRASDLSTTTTPTLSSPETSN